MKFDLVEAVVYTLYNFLVIFLLQSEPGGRGVHGIRLLTDLGKSRFQAIIGSGQGVSDGGQLQCDRGRGVLAEGGQHVNGDAGRESIKGAPWRLICEWNSSAWRSGAAARKQQQQQR